LCGFAKRELEPVIKTENLEVVYNLGKSNEFRALRSVNVDIYPEEYIILFGPSGCGKSTLLYCFLGALPYTFGKLSVKGEDPYQYNSEELVHFQQKTIGIVYQAFYLIPSLSVMDNVSLPLIFAGMSKQDREKRALSLLRRFGVEAQANKLPNSLSGGQQQRVAVSRALVNDPEILLADEPVGNLDAISTEEVMNSLSEVNRRDKKTVILVTHDAKFIPYAHRTFYMTYGKVEREVFNPEIEAIKVVEKGKTIMTEIEKLARIYPYSTVDELRVKSIVNYLTQKLTFEQLERLEKAVVKIIEGKIHEADFKRMLLEKFERGGVGVSTSAGEKMTKQMEKIMRESLAVKRFRKRLVEEEMTGTEMSRYVKHLRTYLLDEYEGQVSLGQLRRLERAVEERISGSAKKEEFELFLGTSYDKGGVGFHWRTARNMTLYLEKLIAQGTRI